MTRISDPPAFRWAPIAASQIALQQGSQDLEGGRRGNCPRRHRIYLKGSQIWARPCPKASTWSEDTQLTFQSWIKQSSQDCAATLWERFGGLLQIQRRFLSRYREKRGKPFPLSYKCIEFHTVFLLLQPCVNQFRTEIGLKVALYIW